jgi:hypothetical protein
MARLGLRYFIVPLPDQLADDAVFKPLRYTFERATALAAARRLTREERKGWRIVATNRSDPVWTGAELNALPDA